VQHQPTLSALSEGIDLGDDLAVHSFLLSPQVRKHVMRLVYAEEWALSIEESHPCGPERDEVIRQHWNEVALIRRALSRYLPSIENLKASFIEGSVISDKRRVKIKWF